MLVPHFSYLNLEIKCSLMVEMIRMVRLNYLFRILIVEVEAIRWVELMGNCPIRDLRLLILRSVKLVLINLLKMLERVEKEEAAEADFPPLSPARRGAQAAGGR